jgi:hypothetical protein
MQLKLLSFIGFIGSIVLNFAKIEPLTISNKYIESALQDQIINLPGLQYEPKFNQ